MKSGIISYLCGLNFLSSQKIKMLHRPKGKFIYLLPWSMAVFLISVGSLINFHQHKIWHQPLVPQIIAHKKDVEYTLTDIVVPASRRWGYVWV